MSWLALLWSIAGIGSFIFFVADLYIKLFFDIH